MGYILLGHILLVVISYYVIKLISSKEIPYSTGNYIFNIL